MDSYPKFTYTTDKAGTVILHTCFLVEVKKNGQKSFIVDMDNYELDEMGTRTKNNKQVNYYKFNIINEK